MPPGFLRLRDHLQREGGLARRLRTKDLDHAPARESADSQRRIHRYRSGGNHIDGNHAARSQPQHGAFAELLIELNESEVDRLLAVFDVHNHKVREGGKDLREI